MHVWVCVCVCVCVYVCMQDLMKSGTKCYVCMCVCVCVRVCVYCYVVCSSEVEWFELLLLKLTVLV